MLANKPALIPSRSIARNLDDETGSLVYSSLSVLANRRYAGAQAKARELLRSRDEYTWFNAALYLGKLRDPAAVPYMIRKLYESYKEEDVRSLVQLENPSLKGLLRRVITKIFNDLEVKGWCSEHEHKTQAGESRNAVGVEAAAAVPVS